MKKTAPTKSFADLRHERDIAQLQQTIRSQQDELHMERSRRELAEAQVAHQGRIIDELKTDVAEWQRSYDELLDRCESMQRLLYMYEEHAGSEEEVRVDAAIAELMAMTDNNGEPLITMGRQWWGIYRILVDHLDYPAGYTQFVKVMTARGMDKVRVPLKLSSLKAIAGTIFEKPFEHWPSLAHKAGQTHQNLHAQMIEFHANLANLANHTRYRLCVPSGCKHSAKPTSAGEATRLLRDLRDSREDNCLIS